MSLSNKDSIVPWTAYWQFESATAGAKRPEMDLLIEPVWFEFVDSLPQEARLLDLATGNGTVALSCAKRARESRIRLQIDAVDAAGISPPNQAADPEGRLPQVQFQGGVWLEELPFEEDTFEGVISQYGFEYADEERAVSEVSRVLATHGRLRLAIHARGGKVWQDIELRNQRLGSVMAKDGAVRLVLELVRAQQKQDVNTFKSKVKHLAAAAKEAQKLVNDPPPDDSALFYAREYLDVWSQRKKYRIDDLLRSLEDGWTHACGTAERYAQMLAVARSAEDIARLCDRLKSSGLTISTVRQICDPSSAQQIAWQLDAFKAG